VPTAPERVRPGGHRSLKVLVAPDGTTMWWTIRYNPRDYPGSSFVYVTRTGSKTWTISAGGYLTPDGQDKGIAELVASPDGSAGRTQTHEGWYLMPFSLTVVQP